MNGNDYSGSFVIPPDLDFPDTVIHDLGYVPGDKNDLYPYVYEMEDETRLTVGMFGDSLGFGWAMCFADGAVWKHDTENLIRIDTATGNFEYYTNDQTIQGPGGLTHDGTDFWVYDRNLPRHIFRFNLVNGAVSIINSFPAPESDVDRALGLTTDSVYLYQMSVNQPLIYKISKEGQVEGTIALSEYFADLVVWDGNGFIGTGGEYGWAKWSADGQFIGSAYPVAHGCWAMDFDGEYAWSMNKTCELWNDPKIFKTIIKNWENTSSGIKITETDISLPEIFPVPATDRINIHINTLERTSFKILSLDGNIQMPQKMIRNSRESVDISHLHAGVYFITFMSGKTSTCKRFIKL